MIRPSMSLANESQMLEFYERHLTFRENVNDDENEEEKGEGNDDDDMNDLVSD